MKAVLLVEAPGPLTTVQDGGRFGHLRHGVTHSGPIDRAGFAAAHAMLGNRAGGAAVEVSHGGVVLKCIEGEVAFALAGGDFVATLDGVALGGWNGGVLRPGGRLVVRDGGASNWATLAFGGEIQCKNWLGSSATLALVGLGGGRLVAGDRVTVAVRPGVEVRTIVPPRGENAPVRVVMGPQADSFSDESVAAFLGESFAIGPAFDRMGVVLQGPAMVPLSVSMLSAPVLRGNVQVNGDGVATILLADHQTTGGYPRIATVISADLDRVAQLRSGSVLQFVAVTASEAVDLARAAAVAQAGWMVPTRFEERLAEANLIDGAVDAQGF
jgi:allophanate hydrolase